MPSMRLSQQLYAQGQPQAQGQAQGQPQQGGPSSSSTDGEVIDGEVKE